MILTEIPRVASIMDETQIQTKRWLMDVASFLFLLTATITRMFRKTPVTPMSIRRIIKMQVGTPTCRLSWQVVV